MSKKKAPIKQKTTTMTFRLPVNLKQSIDLLAEDRKLSPSALVETIIELYIQTICNSISSKDLKNWDLISP